MLCFDFKNNMWNKEKETSPMDFEQYLRKSGLSEDNKVYWNERYCYASKRREMYNILKSLLSTDSWWRYEGGTGWSMFFLEPTLQFSYVIFNFHTQGGTGFTSLSEFQIILFFKKFRFPMPYYHPSIQHVAKKYYIISIRC